MTRKSDSQSVLEPPSPPHRPRRSARKAAPPPSRLRWGIGLLRRWLLRGGAAVIVLILGLKHYRASLERIEEQIQPASGR